MWKIAFEIVIKSLRFENPWLSKLFIFTSKLLSSYNYYHHWVMRILHIITKYTTDYVPTHKNNLVLHS